MSWLGIDVGGANLKLATSNGAAVSVPFALYREPENLAERLQDVEQLLTSTQPAAKRIALTMTGELCDCFPTKAAGVRHILKAVVQVAERRPVAVYAGDRGWHSSQRALERWRDVAAMNWHATARWIADLSSASAVLVVDMGSTTTDLTMVNGQGIAKSGRSDFERLASGGLVYLGCERTPVASLLSHVPWEGHRISLAAENFATIGDVLRVLGQQPPDRNESGTADGRPKSVLASRKRLARMLCSDCDELPPGLLDHLAERAEQAARDRILTAAERVLATGQAACCVVMGAGEPWLAELLSAAVGEVPLQRLSQQVGEEISQAAPAWAVANLARQRIAMRPPFGVVKVGGSLLAEAELPGKLKGWLRRQRVSRWLIVPGGGALVETLRAINRRAPLGEAACHWLAIDLMGVAAEVLSRRTGWRVVYDSWPEAAHSPQIVSVKEFMVRVEPQSAGRRLPESWNVTSDSIAARLAEVLGADQCVLLKHPAALANDPLELCDGWLQNIAAEIPGLRIEAW